MSEGSFFQYYNQKENVITNNTMLLLSHYYNHSISLFNKFIREVFDTEDIYFGVEIYNQEKCHNSIPDAVIKQKSMEVIVETKRNSKDFSLDQLKRHLNDKDKENTYLLCLAPQENWELNQDDIDDFSVCYISFKKIIDILKSLTHDWNTSLLTILENFEN